MTRMRISLDKHEHALAKRQAKALGISLAEFVRRAVRESLSAQGGGAWMKFAGLVASGDSRSRRSIDDHVYGQRG